MLACWQFKIFFGMLGISVPVLHSYLLKETCEWYEWINWTHAQCTSTVHDLWTNALHTPFKYAVKKIGINAYLGRTGNRVLRKFEIFLRYWCRPNRNLRHIAPMFTALAPDNHYFTVCIHRILRKRILPDLWLQYTAPRTSCYISNIIVAWTRAGKCSSQW